MSPTTDGAEKGPSDTPLPVVRQAFYNVAHGFELIRDEWKKGDQEQFKLLADCFFGSETRGYAELMKGQIRAPVDRIVTKLTTDPDFLPFILPYCDPSLRDCVQRMVRLLRTDLVQSDRYGQESERWRQTWSAMSLDGDLDELLPKLRAAGDALLVHQPGGDAPPRQETNRSFPDAEELLALSNLIDPVESLMSDAEAMRRIRDRLSSTEGPQGELVPPFDHPATQATIDALVANEYFDAICAAVAHEKAQAQDEAAERDLLMDTLDSLLHARLCSMEYGIVDNELEKMAFSMNLVLGRWLTLAADLSESLGLDGGAFIRERYLRTRESLADAKAAAHKLRARASRPKDDAALHAGTDAPASEKPQKLPTLKPWAMEAWRARQAGATVSEIAIKLSKKYEDKYGKITQPRVTEQIQRAQKHTEASRLSEVADRVLSKAPPQAPARTLDPADVEMGRRVDGRAHHLREKAREIEDEGFED